MTTRLLALVLLAIVGLVIAAMGPELQRYMKIRSM